MHTVLFHKRSVLMECVAFVADGTDYQGGVFSITLGMASNSTSCTSVTILDDQIIENVEQFQVALLVPTDTGVVPGDRRQTTIIVDDRGIVCHT